MLNICERVLDDKYEEWRDESQMPALLLTGENLGHFDEEAWDIALRHKEIGECRHYYVKKAVLDWSFNNYDDCLDCSSPPLLYLQCLQERHLHRSS